MIRDFQQLFSLAGQVAIITNATTAIGMAAVRGLSQSGAIVCGSGINIFTCPTVSQEQPHNFDRVKTLACLYGELERKYGRLNTMVNVGEIDVASRLKNPNITAKSVKATNSFRYRIETQLDNSLNAIRQALPYLKQSGGGSIINIIAIDNAVGFPHDFSYIATKNALLTTKKFLAASTEDSIRINNIVVGYRQQNASDASETKQMSRPRQDVIQTTIAIASNNSNWATGDIFIKDDCTLTGLV